MTAEHREYKGQTEMTYQERAAAFKEMDYVVRVLEILEEERSLKADIKRECE